MKTTVDVSKIVEKDPKDFDFALEVFSDCDSFDSKRVPICDIKPKTKTHVTGVVRSVLLVPQKNTYTFEAYLFDGTGTVVLVWLGRSDVKGIESGAMLSAFGFVSEIEGRLVIYNPSYDLS